VVSGAVVSGITRLNRGQRAIDRQAERSGHGRRNGLSLEAERLPSQPAFDAPFRSPWLSAAALLEQTN
jgi:hypothetical protein